MQKRYLSLFQLAVAIFMILFAVFDTKLAFAWTSPTQSPPNCPTTIPGCNTPINISDTVQSKTGGLNVATGSGSFGIGTTSPNQKLQIANGNVRIGEINPVNTGTLPGFGRFLYFSGGPAGSTWNSENSDSIWIARYNKSSDSSALQINVGDGSDPADSIEFGTSISGVFTPRMSVRADGNVGIGTTGPTNNLSIGSVGVGTFTGIGVGASANADLRIGQGPSNNVIVGWKYNATPASAYAIVETYGGNNPLALQSSGGNVGIGTTAPVTTLDVNGNALVRSTMTVGQSSLFSGNNAQKLNVLGEIKSFGSVAGLRMEDRSSTTDSSKEWVIYPNANYLRFWSGLRGDLVAINYDTGNVGIGTTAPGAKLDIVSGGQRIQFLTGTNTSGYTLSIGVNDNGVNISNNSSIRGFNFTNAGGQTIQLLTGTNTSGYTLSIGVNDDGVNIANNSTGRGFVFKNGNGTLVTITSGGNVGIGTTNPGSYKLYVNGSAFATGGWASSDLRLKKNIEKLNGVIEKLKNINGVTFDWRTDEFPNKGLPEGRQIGLIAQEVEKEFPELVNTDNEGYKAVSYEHFTAVLLEALKEQQKQIDKQQEEINELQRKINELLAR
jgi:hypothetical protein